MTDRPSDRAYAQAIRELENWPPGDQLSPSSAAGFLNQRAREIDAAAPEGAQEPVAFIDPRHLVLMRGATGFFSNTLRTPNNPGEGTVPLFTTPHQPTEAAVWPDAGFDYQRTFNAIAAATTVTGNCIGISVQAFNKAMLYAPSQFSEAARDREDAERYRWLRVASLERNSAEGGIPWPVIVKREHGVPTMVGCFEIELDAAIDAMRGKESQR